jgi:hypothetical protein
MRVRLLAALIVTNCTYSCGHVRSARAGTAGMEPEFVRRVPGPSTSRSLRLRRLAVAAREHEAGFNPC